MADHYFTAEDRKAQLAALASALRELIPVIASLSPVAHRDVEYRSALEQCQHLLQVGFTQEQLSALSRSVPDLFFRHKEWGPPLEQAPDGRWLEASWFANLDSKLQPVLRAAEALRYVGYY